MKLFAFLLVVLIGAASAFVSPSAFKGSALAAPRATRATSKVSATPVMLDTYWEGKAPPSEVLGPALAKAPSVGLGVVSLVAFAAGTYCIHETNILHTVSPDNIQPLYVAGALLVPISWGLHVASWIQKQNGK
ncbi:unnamed protein product [Ectocarpus fasciculatus]